MDFSTNNNISNNSNNTINNILRSGLLSQNKHEIYTNIDSNIERLVEKVINFDECFLEKLPHTQPSQHWHQKQLLVDNLIQVNNDLKHLLAQITSLHHNSKKFEELKLSFDILNNEKIQLENALKTIYNKQNDIMIVDNDRGKLKDIKTENSLSEENMELRTKYSQILNENKMIKSKIKDYNEQKDKLSNLENKYKKLETENDKKNLEITRLQNINKKLKIDYELLEKSIDSNLSNEKVSLVKDIKAPIENLNLQNTNKKIKTEHLSNDIKLFEQKDFCDNERIEIDNDNDTDNYKNQNVSLKLDYEKIKQQNAKLEHSNKHVSSLYNNLLKTYNSTVDTNKQLLAQNNSYGLKLSTIANENTFLINEIKAKHEKEMTDLKTIMINKCDLVNNKNSKLEDEIKELIIENKLIKKNNNDNERIVNENKNLVDENKRLGIINKDLENEIKTFRNKRNFKQKKTSKD